MFTYVNVDIETCCVQWTHLQSNVLHSIELTHESFID